MAANKNEAMFTVIVPCIEIDMLTVRCVKEIINLHPSTPIVVLSDLPSECLLGELVQVIVTGQTTISAKRNWAADISKTAYLAFIDSDAYPIEDWLTNALPLLQCPDVGAVGGPNLSPPEQSRSEQIVGYSLKSLLVSGIATYRKVRSNRRNVDDLPSCNLIVKRNVYQHLGGMNEDLFTGEDVDFCIRLRDAGLRIVYDPNIAVYHKNRDLKRFILQRITYGASVPELLKKGLNKRCLIMLLPAFALLYLAAFPIIIWVGFFVLSYLAMLILYCIVVVFEAIRLSSVIMDIPSLILVLVVGNLAPGIGTIGAFLKILPDRRNLYRNDTS